MSSGSLTTTSYAILGLLAIKPWSTYELTQQMDRSLGRIWPRAESKLYEEPKKLVSHGLARSERRYRGKRASTVYEITPAGRRALADWVRSTGDAAPTLDLAVRAGVSLRGAVRSTTGAAVPNAVVELDGFAFHALRLPEKLDSESHE